MIGKYILLTLMVPNAGGYFHGPIAISEIPYFTKEACERSAKASIEFAGNDMPQLHSLCFIREKGDHK